MRKSLETAVDVASTVMAGAALNAIDAPWWTYFIVLLFGAGQQLVGRNRGKADILKQGLENFIILKLRTIIEKKSSA